MKRAIYLLIGFVALAGAPLRAGDWPQWLGPHRDGSTTEKIDPWKTAPKAVWSREVGLGYGTPIVADNRVYVHARIPDANREEVLAFQADTGELLWRVPYYCEPYRRDLTNGPQATPAFSQGALVTYGMTGMLTCFEAGTGKIRWQVDPFVRFQVPLPRYGVTSSPLVVGSTVMVAVAGKGSSLVGFDLKSGKVVWQAVDETANTSSPILVPTSPSTVAFMSRQRLYGIDPLTGRQRWDYTLPNASATTAPTPVVVGNTLVASIPQGGSLAVPLEPAGSTGHRPAWSEKSIKGQISSGVQCRSGLLFLVAADGPHRVILCCLDGKTGKEHWRKSDLGRFHLGLLRLVDDRLLIVDDSGTARLIDPSPQAYRELCSASVCGPTLVTPALAGGRLFVRDDKAVTCLPLVLHP